MAFKPNVRDPRNSPAADVMAGLRERGAADVPRPAWPMFRLADGSECAETGLDELLEASDVVVIVTPHKAIDWDAVFTRAELIVDDGKLVARATRPRAPGAPPRRGLGRPPLSHGGADPGPEDPGQSSPRARPPDRHRAQAGRRDPAAGGRARRVEGASGGDARRAECPATAPAGADPARARAAAAAGRAARADPGDAGGRAGRRCGGSPRSTPGSRGGAGAAGDGGADEAAERAFLDAIGPQLGGPARTSGPLASIVLLNREGPTSSGSLPGLAATA